MAPPKRSKKSALIEVLKSPNDPKAYRYVKLASGMSVLLISDPQILVEDDEDDMDEDSSEGGEGDDMDEGEDEDGSESGSSDSKEDAEEGGEGEEGGRNGKGKGKKAVKKAAAAMAVGVGSFSDPDDLPGLSHYLEHMLFMGSKKYPNENEYDQYLQQHGGSSNAYTELEVTNYHFEVAPDSLQGALDRFAQFFLGPLLKADSMEREVCAVDSEFAGVQQDDQCRLMQLMCHTAIPDHIYRKFTWGNKKSLMDTPQAAGVDVRARLQKHHKEYYSAERMSLVLLGGEDLDTLQGWVSDIFAKLGRGRGPRPLFDKAGLPFQGRVLYVAPAVRDLHEVAVTFQLPPLRAEYRKKSEHYISHLVGHEGPGSLLSALKVRGWASNLSAGVDEGGYSSNTCCSLFSVNITLTDAGLAAGPGLGLAPVGLLFQYLDMLRTTGPQQWVYEEIKLIAEMKFRFAEEEDAMEYTSSLASSLHTVAPEHVLAAESLHLDWDAKRVSELMEAMHPGTSSYRVDLQTRSYKEAQPALAALAANGSIAVTADTEPWFGMDASWVQLPEAVTSGWSNAAALPELRLPPPNPYVASDFELCGGVPSSSAAEGAVPGPTPEDERADALGLPLVLATPPDLLVNRPGLLLWHKMDHTFRTPRAAAHFRLSSPAGHASPRGAALQELLLQLLEGALTEDAYLADVAALHYSTSSDGSAGIEVKVEGFSHKLPLLTSRIFAALCAGEFTPAVFEVVKEAQLRKYRNMNFKVSKHANWSRLYMLCRKMWHYTAVQKELELITLADIQPFVKSLLSSCHLEALFHGNLTRGASSELAERVLAMLGPGCIMSAAARQQDQCVQIAPNAEVLHRNVAINGEEENCSVEVYLQCCTANNDVDRTVIDLLDQLMFEPCYDALRTKQQLGYSVSSGVRHTHDVLGFCFSVVSASHAPELIEERIVAFLDTFSEKLRDMKDAEFEQNLRSLVSTKLQKDRHLADETMRHWEQIWGGRYDFYMREREVVVLEGIKLEEVRAWFAKYLANGAPQRRKLTVRVAPTKVCPANATGTAPASRVIEVADLDAFKVSQPLWPLPPRGEVPAAVGIV